VLKKTANASAHGLVIVIWLGIGILVRWATYPSVLPVGLAIIIGGGIAGATIRTLGFLVAGVACGMEIREYRLGSPVFLSFQAGKTKVRLGLPVSGDVVHGPTSAGRRAVFLLAGPLADLVAAAVVLALPISWPVAVSLGTVIAGFGISVLIPYSGKKGPSTGAYLLTVRAYGRAAPLRADADGYDADPSARGRAERASRWLAAYRAGDPWARDHPGALGYLLRHEGMITDLLDVHAGLPAPGNDRREEPAEQLHTLEWNVIVLPGLAPDVVDVAADRVQWVADNFTFERAAVLHTLAVARLRQGRFADVEPLCAKGLAAKYDAANRATVLATVALARQALGQPYADLLAQAVALAPDADLVAEAAAVDAP
jgi:hypothetical protein